jgi:uncharacterized protein involved in exopolysaccharide biosynthesis
MACCASLQGRNLTHSGNAMRQIMARRDRAKGLKAMNLAHGQNMLEAPQPSALGVPIKNIDLDMARSLRMHRTVAIAVAVAVFLCLFGFGLSRRPYYSASSLIYVQPLKSKAITDTSDDAYDAQRYETYLQQQFQTIVRPDVLRDALSKPAARSWRLPGETMDSAVARLQHALKIERVEQSYELSITLSGGNPVMVSNVTNAVTSSYIHAAHEDELGLSSEQLQILQQELDRVTNNLTDARRQQAQLSVSLGMADTAAPDASNPFDTQLADLRAELGKASAAHSVAAAQAATMSADSSGLRSAADELIAVDPGLAALKQTIGQRRSALISQMSDLTPKNPIYQQDQDELNHLGESITAMENAARNHAIQQLEQKNQLDVQRSAEVEERLRSQLAQQTSIATGATPTLQRAADLAANIARLQSRYTVVSSAINSIQLERDTSGLVHILVAATPPVAPKTSVKRLILAAAIPLALLSAIAASLLLSRFDRHIYIAKDVSRSLGFFPMATMPSPQEVGKRGQDEFVLRLLGGVDQIHRTDGANMFVFTPASEHTDINDLVDSLARKMERLGYRVRVVFASELIEGRELASGFFEPGDEPAPTVVTRGNFIVEKLAAMKIEADFVFMKSFPIMSSSEAEFAARLADVVVLVAESAQTTRSELASSFSLIRRLRVPGAAIVLTGVRLHDADDAFIETLKAVRMRLHEA